MSKTILILLFFINTCAAQNMSVDKNKVMDLFQNQQFDEAIEYVTPAAANDSNNMQLLGFLGYANYMNGEIRTAEKYYQRIFMLDSTNISALQYLASIKSNGNVDMAKTFTSRLIALQPTKASYYKNMGDLFRRSNEKDSALLYYDHAYLLSPNDLKNGIGLADILLDIKTYTRGDSIIAIGLAKDSLNISFLKLSIRSAYETKNFKNALLPGERLMRLEDISLNPLTQVVLSYYNLKMYDDCIRSCEYMLTRELDIEAIYYYEAKAWSKLKNFTKSNELLQTCVAKAISHTAELYYYNLGENYEALKQYKKATMQYDTAYYLFKNPVMKYNCGRIYESNLNDNNLAKKNYTIFLRTAKPQTADEKKAYEFVKTRWGKKK